MTKNSRRPIALFIPYLNGGGAQRVVVNLANAFIDLTGRPVHVVLVRAEGEFLDDLRPEVYVHDLQKRRTLSSVVALSQYLRKIRPVVLLSRMNYANVAAVAAWMLAGHPCRLVLSEANVVRQPEEKWLSRGHQKALRLLMRWLYPRADTVVANSEETAQSLVQSRVLIKGKPCVIYNPVIVEYQPGRYNEPLPVPPDKQNTSFICAIGRLAEQKGFDQLLDAFARLPDRSLELVILGEGPLRDALEQQAEQLGIAERVHMPGFIPEPARVLAQSALFVLSSRWEGFGNVLVEALATGVPIVSTDCPGAPRYILHDGALGHLVPPDDSQALAHAITDALTLPRATREARQERAGDFATPVIARQYLVEAFDLAADIEYVEGYEEQAST